MTGGGTGATEKHAARPRASPYRKVYIHPSGHAGYYPGTAPMHIKLLFAPDDGRVLGAQVVGYDGVDKRLDVFATAIRAGPDRVRPGEARAGLRAAVRLGQGPGQHGRASSASNLLRGDLGLWYAEDYPDELPGRA